MLHAARRLIRALFIIHHSAFIIFLQAISGATVCILTTPKIKASKTAARGLAVGKSRALSCACGQEKEVHHEENLFSFSRFHAGALGVGESTGPCRWARRRQREACGER